MGSPSSLALGQTRAEAAAQAPLRGELSWDLEHEILTVSSVL